jgi:hypothetical protein
MAQSLGQVIARESLARSDANKRLGEIHKNVQKHQLFEGLRKDYEPFSETEDEARTGAKRLPSETKAVQFRGEEMLSRFLAEYAPAIDLAAAKDFGNTEAFADVVVDGTVLLGRLPATHLLHMEKVLDDWATFIAGMPVQDPAEHWSAVRDDGLVESQPEVTIRAEVKKVPLILHEPTDRHPAQVAIIDETVNAGKWTKVRYSGALTAGRKRELAQRAAVLKAAFKVAREEANRTEAQAKVESQFLIGYLLG